MTTVILSIFKLHFLVVHFGFKILFVPWFAKTEQDGSWVYKIVLILIKHQ